MCHQEKCLRLKEAQWQLSAGGPHTNISLLDRYRKQTTIDQGRLPWGWQRLCPQGWAYLSDKTGGLCPHCPLFSVWPSNFVNQQSCSQTVQCLCGNQEGLSLGANPVAGFSLNSAGFSSPPFVWSESCPQSLTRMLSITAEVSSLSPPYLKFLCCTAFSSRAFIFLSDLITQ